MLGTVGAASRVGLEGRCEFATAPRRWEIDDADPRDFTMATRYAAIGDLFGGTDDHVFDIAPLLEWDGPPS